MGDAGGDRPGPGRARRLDLDLVVVSTVAGVILAHTVLIFTPGPYAHPYSVRNDVTYRGLVELQLVWGFAGLPIFFAISGWNSLASLRSRGPGAYLRERAKRLLVPLVFWMAAIGPVIKYLELRSGFDLRLAGPRLCAPTEWTFLEFLPRFYTRMNTATWAHLYFLFYLAFISCVCLPVLLGLQRLERERAEPAAGPGDPAMTTARRGLAYLPLVLTVGHQLAAGGFWPLYFNFVDDLNHVSLFALFFVLGALVGSFPKLERAVRAEWWRLGLLGIASFLAHVRTADTVLGDFLGGLAAWGCFGGSLGLAQRLRPREGPLLAYAREATLPVYVLHNVFTVSIGFVVVRQDWHDLVKGAVILSGTLAATLGLYHFAIRPFAPMRFLCGMRPMRPG